MMSIKTVNALSHYTDWTIGHVHSGALGWVAMISIGAMYHLIPIMFGKKRMYSVGADQHALSGCRPSARCCTSASMWVNGIMQGLMWRAYNADGTLTYSFVEAVQPSYPGYVVRLIGGAMFFGGMLLMAYNVWQTVAGSRNTAIPATASAA